jgi:hypothetical protein
MDLPNDKFWEIGNLWRRPPIVQAAQACPVFMASALTSVHILLYDQYLSTSLGNTMRTFFCLMLNCQFCRCRLCYTYVISEFCLTGFESLPHLFVRMKGWSILELYVLYLLAFPINITISSHHSFMVIRKFSSPVNLALFVNTYQSPLAGSLSLQFSLSTTMFSSSPTKGILAA